jgi:hypothetical protein
MKEKITESINDPEALEKLYRENKNDFARYFPEIAPDYHTDIVKFWQIRLKPETRDKTYSAMKTGILVVLGIIVATGLLVKLPGIFNGLDEEYFYFRNLAAIVFAGLIIYTSWQKRITGTREILILILPVIVLVVFLNLLPDIKSDTVKLACIHAPVMLWFFFGLAYCSPGFRNNQKISGFIRYNGELVIMTGLILAAGGLLSGMTISLFAVIGIDIARFYTENVALIGGVISPVVAAWLIASYPDITSKIAPVIARIFTPLVLVSAVIYLVAISVSGISLSENREFLIFFNLLLLAVMAIIVFSVSELDKSKIKKLNVLLLFLLTAITLIINIFALIAIISRLSGGITPNRMVVMVSNILVFINLALVLPGLYSAYFRRKSPDQVVKTITGYLPVYFFYSIAIIFLLPFIFSMK